MYVGLICIVWHAVSWGTMEAGVRHVGMQRVRYSMIGRCEEEYAEMDPATLVASANPAKGKVLEDTLKHMRLHRDISKEAHALAWNPDADIIGIVHNSDHKFVLTARDCEELRTLGASRGVGFEKVAEVCGRNYLAVTRHDMQTGEGGRVGM